MRFRQLCSMWDMVSPTTWQRWRDDRKRLKGALRDYEAGRTPGVSKNERDAVIDSLKRRISDLTAKLEHNKTA